MYDVGLGRFISADTIVPEASQPQSFNRYSYGYNNPVKYQDPSGHFAWIPLGLAGGALGGALYGYGSQVVHNLNQGMNLGQSLSTDIDLGKIVLYTGAGALIGVGIGGLAVGVTAIVGVVAPPMAATVGTTAGAVGTGVCADGDPTNEAVAVGNVGYSALSRATEFGIKSFNALQNATKGTGLQRHHIIEQRFASGLGLDPGQMPSAVLTPEEHQLFTSMWRDAIPYINSGQALNTLTATREQIWLAAQRIYADYPALLEAARQTLLGE
jgi:hypothetical protein